MSLDKAKKYQFKYLQEKLNHWNALHFTEDEPFLEYTRMKEFVFFKLG